MYVETSNNMAIAKATFEGFDIPNLNIDNNVDDDMIFMSDCTQSGTSSLCSAAPFYATSGVSSSSLSGVGINFTAHDQGGFSTNGRIA